MRQKFVVTGSDVVESIAERLSYHLGIVLHPAASPGRRLAIALAISLVLHAMAVFGLRAGRGHGVAGIGATVLSARLVDAHSGEQTLAAEESAPQVTGVTSTNAKGPGGAGLRPPAVGKLPFDFAQSGYYYIASRLHKQPIVQGKIPFEFPEDVAVREGTVTARVLINARGGVDDVIVEGAVPAGVFEAAAVKALATVKFSPGELHGVAVACQVIFEVRYSNPGGNAGVGFTLKSSEPMPVSGGAAKTP